MYRFCIILSGLFLTILPGKAQLSGRIVFMDGTYSEISEFRQIRSEFYYYEPAGKPETDYCEIMNFMPGGTWEKAKRIKFISEKGVGTDKFCYEFLIECTSSDGSLLTRKFKAWDWMEMDLPGNRTGRSTEITFFSDDKKLDIERIEFY